MFAAELESWLLERLGVTGEDTSEEAGAVRGPDELVLTA